MCRRSGEETASFQVCDGWTTRQASGTMVRQRPGEHNKTVRPGDPENQPLKRQQDQLDSEEFTAFQR